MNIVFNPMEWPSTRPRLTKPRAAMLGRTPQIKVVVRKLTEQLELLGVAPGTIRITTDVPLPADGMPRAKSGRCPDVAVWFHSKASKRYCLTSGRWNSVRSNLIAVYDTVESLRTIELAGVTEIVLETLRKLEVPPEPEPRPNTYYTYSKKATEPGRGPNGGYTDFGDMWREQQRRHGFTPPPVVPKPPPVEPWHRVLGVEAGATTEQAEKAFATLARQFHPDRNPGDAKAEAKFKEINNAFEAFKRGRR